VVILVIGLMDRGATFIFSNSDWMPFIRIVVWASGLVAYLLSIRLLWSRSSGDWLLSIRRYRFSQLRGYAGKGAVACVEE
jgi:hypothetical protein